MRTRLVVFALLLPVVLATAGCTPAAESSPREPSSAGTTAPKTGDGELRTDLEPIAKRYPQLSEAESVAWMSGTTGTSDIGPATYWVDAVVVLPATQMDALLDIKDLVEIDSPVLVEGVASNLPSGPFFGSPTLDALFAENGYGATVALDPKTRTVVLSGLFGN